MLTKNKIYNFSHDVDMRNDLKIRGLRRKFGNNGYAIWCYLLEVLTDTEEFEIDVDTMGELLAADFDTTIEELVAVVDYCVKVGLFVREDGHIYSLRHRERIRNVCEKSEARAEAGRKGAQMRWGENSNAIANHSNAIAKHSNAIANHSNKRKEIKERKERKEAKEIKENKIKENKIKENNVKEKFPYNLVVDLWNKTCGGILPKVAKLNDSRRTKIKLRLSESDAKTTKEMETWAQGLFTKIIASDFLLGKNNNQWQATFDWVFANSTNWVKVLEGNYDNQRGAKKSRTEVGNNLGVGEYITDDGRRTYGSGKANIPMSAPKRPSERYQWSAETQTWIMI